jgi:plastocyanin
MNLKRAVKVAAACLLAVVRLIAGEPSGAVEGRIIFNGEIPKSIVPDNSGNRDPLVDVDAQSKGLRDVVVFLKTPPAHRTSPEQLPPAKMDQVNNRFVPRVMAARAGQRIRFTNSDAGNHNVRSSSSVATNEFNIFTAVEGNYERAFSANPSGQPIRIGCDIHPWMRGWIYIFDHPFFAITDHQGRFRISGLPPGEHELILTQPDLGYREAKKITIRPGQTAVLNAEARAQPSTASQTPDP